MGGKDDGWTASRDLEGGDCCSVGCFTVAAFMVAMVVCAILGFDLLEFLCQTLRSLTQ